NQSQVRVGVDADPSGNTATSISDVQDCREVGLDDSFQIDVFVEDVSNLDGLQFNLVYNPDVVNVVGLEVDSENTFLASGSSGPLIDLSNFDDPVAMEDTDGTFVVAVGDFGDAESGEGVLARISLRAIGTGQSDLALANLIITSLNAQGTSLPIEGVIITNAAVAVEASCEPPEQPIPPTPPPPAATDAAPGLNGTADVDTDEPGGGTSGNGDDGNDSTTWIVIGIAAGAVALIAVGGAIAWQRGKQD
ncbi:MAG: hypothetical protein IIA90_00390, partial [Chloroflexi bacterium]|nr:hypothetical protein [Chloroflexota bacterium]